MAGSGGVAVGWGFPGRLIPVTVAVTAGWTDVSPTFDCQWRRRIHLQSLGIYSGNFSGESPPAISAPTAFGGGFTRTRLPGFLP